MVSIEMIFHAKALELFTQCYQSLADISEDTDLEVRYYFCHYSLSLNILFFIDYSWQVQEYHNDDNDI